MNAGTTASVSYVVTVYNKEAFLPAVLAALAAEQADTGGEILLVDDGSTDGSARLLAEFAASNRAARILPQPNRGVAAATNRGIAAAACPYIRLVDADDVVVKGSTARLRSVLDATGCDFAYGRMGHVPEPVRKGTPKYHVVADPLAAMLKTQPFIPSMSLGTATALKAVLPLPENVGTSQDFSLGVRVAALSCFVEVDTLCCIVPKASGGLSANKARMFRDTAVLCLRFFDELKWSRRHRRLAVQRNAGRARNYFRRHARVERSKIVAFSAIALVCKLPIPFPYRRAMSYIARAYDSIGMSSKGSE